MAGVAKQTLKLTLKILYGRILKSLNNAPESSFYRQNTARIVSERLQAVEAEPDISKLEKKIGMGQIEEVIVQAINELELARNMTDYKPWEPLVGEAPPDQWRWPV